MVRGRFWTEVNYSVVDEGLNIYVMGDPGDSVYFVVDGSVELIHHRSLDPYDRVTPVDERSGATVVSEGGYFGLTSMFPVSIPSLVLTSNSQIRSLDLTSKTLNPPLYLASAVVSISLGGHWRNAQQSQAQQDLI